MGVYRCPINTVSISVREREREREREKGREREREGGIVRLCRRSHKKIDAEPAVEMTSSARHLFCCLRFADFGVTVAVQPLTHTQHNHGWRVHAQHVLAIHLSQDVAAQNSCLYMYTYTYMYMHMHIIDILTCIYMSFLWQDHFWQHHRGWLECALLWKVSSARLACRWHKPCYLIRILQNITSYGKAPAQASREASVPSRETRRESSKAQKTRESIPTPTRAHTHTHTHRARKSWTCTSLTRFGPTSVIGLWKSKFRARGQTW